MLRRIPVVEQAAVLDRQLFDFLPSFDDGLIPSEVDVSGCEVAEAFVVSEIIVMAHEGVDLAFEVARQAVVLQQDPVFQRLVPTLDLTLGLGMVRRATDMIQLCPAVIDRWYKAGHGLFRLHHRKRGEDLLRLDHGPGKTAQGP